ncbi:MAG: putative sulfate exporter family transporter [Propionicimonas sp.]
MPAPSSSAPTPATGVRARWPGLLLAAVGAAVSVLVNQFLPTVSAMLVAILLGALLGNLIPGGIPARLSPGLAVASRRLLRLGVVLLGLQLVLGDIAGLGWPVVVGVLVVVSGTYLVTLLIGRLLGIADTQTMLVASGFSICGAAAVAGMEGVLPRRKDEEVATAIALVVVFGTLMIAVMPA